MMLIRKVKRVVYEWDYEEFDAETGDIIDHHYFESDEFPGLPTEPGFRLVLVRDVWENFIGVDFFKDWPKHVGRSWCYVENGRLPTTFDDGIPVPQRFIKVFTMGGLL
tara:strand:- start:225 stop:548 length:324 start_codon:yes stop_codon:yes gene_type:complete